MSLRFLTALATRRTVFTTAMLALTLSCQQCQTGVDSLGNLDRVTDVVVVAAADGNSYAVTANPELQHLRVVDLTSGRFVTSPNRYFPLSPPSAASQLAVAVDVVTATVDPTRVFGLDPTADHVDIVGTPGIDDADDGAVDFPVLGGFDVGRGAVDLAAIRFDGGTLVAVTHADDATIDIYAVADDNTAALLTNVALPAGARPGVVVADSFGRAFLVADNALPNIYAIEPAADGSSAALARTVDVGGAVGNLAAGIVDVGDGEAPVVLVLRRSDAAAVLVRLYRPGRPEDRYEVLGGTQLPSLGVTAYVPDVRASAAPVTVCCKLTTTTTTDGVNLTPHIVGDEASANIAAVTIADGTILYVQLAAKTIDGVTLGGERRAVRLVDNDPAPPGPSVIRNINGGIDSTVDVNTLAELWVPAAGGESLRPTVAFAAIDNWGSPPFVTLVPSAASLLLVWEGDLPGARRLAGTFDDENVRFDTGIDLAARDVRAGDVARLETVDGTRLDCPASLRAEILDVVDGVVTLASEGSGGDVVLGDDDIADCLVAGGEIVMTVEVADSFVVTRNDVFQRRLYFAEPYALPGVTVTLTPAPAGVPLPGSRLAVPLDARVETSGLNLSDGFTLSRTLVPTAMAGGTVVIPDAASSTTTTTIAARRMVISYAAADPRTVNPALFTCDEAETTVGHVESLQ